MAEPPKISISNLLFFFFFNLGDLPLIYLKAIVMIQYVIHTHFGAVSNVSPRLRG